MIPLQEVHDWTSKTCDYVTLCGRREFADMIKDTDIELGDYLGLHAWAQSNYMSP